MIFNEVMFLQIMIVVLLICCFGFVHINSNLVEINKSYQDLLIESESARLDFILKHQEIHQQFINELQELVNDPPKSNTSTSTRPD